METLVVALLLFEMLAAPMPMVGVPVPEVYRFLAKVEGGRALLHLPGLPAREELLYQTVHRQRLVQNLESAVPLRSRRGPDPFADPAWSVLTRSLAAPGWLGRMPEASRERIINELGGFLRANQIRAVVILRSRPALSPDGKSFREEPMLNEPAVEAYREHLRMLGPTEERVLGEAIVFLFP